MSTMRDPTWYIRHEGVPCPHSLRVVRFLKQQGRFVVECLNISAGLQAHDVPDVPFTAAVCIRAVLFRFANDLPSSNCRRPSQQRQRCTWQA